MHVHAHVLNTNAQNSLPLSVIGVVGTHVLPTKLMLTVSKYASTHFKNQDSQLLQVNLEVRLDCLGQNLVQEAGQSRQSLH